MPTASTPWPIRLFNYFNNCLCRLVLLCALLPQPNFAQEPNIDPESSSTTQASSSRSSEAPPYPSRDMRDKTLIAKQFTHEAQWLDTEQGKILVLHRITEAKTTHGVLVLFHATENPQSWPPLLENLRANLPRYGWETLAVSLPQKHTPIIPARPFSSAESIPPTTTETSDTASAASASTTSSSQNSSSIAQAASRAELIEAYVNAAFTYLAEKNLYNVVVLTDNSSALLSLSALLAKIQDNPSDPNTVDGPLQALIIANLQNQEPLNISELEAIFSTRQLPVLDTFFAPDNIEQEKARNEHRAVAMRKKIERYQQLLLSEQPKNTEDDHQSYLLGRVRGFMLRHASGVELEKSPAANQ